MTHHYDSSLGPQSRRGPHRDGDTAGQQYRRVLANEVVGGGNCVRVLEDCPTPIEEEAVDGRSEHFLMQVGLSKLRTQVVHCNHHDVWTRCCPHIGVQEKEGQHQRHNQRHRHKATLNVYLALEIEVVVQCLYTQCSLWAIYFKKEFSPTSSYGCT